jgi:hypothetical protein
MKIEVGDKVYLPNEKKPYKVQVRDNRYIICTKPFNPKHTVLYFIIDLVRKVRGTDNMIYWDMMSGVQSYVLPRYPQYARRPDIHRAMRDIEAGMIEGRRQRTPQH